MRRLLTSANCVISLIQIALSLFLMMASAYAATPASWVSTNWKDPQAVIIAPGTAGIPYVEKAELGPTAFGLYNNEIGIATATWQDSNTAWLVAGAPNESDDTGAVYVFSRPIDSAVWHQEARLTAMDGKANEFFGVAVAISGNMMVVGTPYPKFGSNSGAVYTFVRDSTSGVWSQRGDALSIATTGSIGSAVGLNGDTLAIGAPGGGTSGHVYVYQNSGTSWTLVGSLSPSDSPSGAFFGGSIALDSERLLIGASEDSTFAKDEGSAYVFGYQSATNSWEQQQKLVPYPDGAAGDSFGETVALLGQTAVVAAPARNSGKGAVDLFSFDSGHDIWLKYGTLQGADTSFGHSLALAVNTLAVGSIGTGTTDPNVISLYTLASGTATFQARLPTGSQPIPGNFGQSLSWSNGDLLVSAPLTTIDAENRGLIREFSATASGWSERQPITALGDQGENFGISRRSVRRCRRYSSELSTRLLRANRRSGYLWTRRERKLGLAAGVER